MDDGEGGLSFDFEGGLDLGPTHPTASNPVIQPSDASASAIGASSAAANITNNSMNPSVIPPAAAGVGAAAPDGGMGTNQRRSFRQTVCRHWLRSLCMKGDACGFLHQYDKSRMPSSRCFQLYGECREQDCVYKHTNEDIKECNMYVSFFSFSASWFFSFFTSILVLIWPYTWRLNSFFFFFFKFSWVLICKTYNCFF